MVQFMPCWHTKSHGTGQRCKMVVHLVKVTTTVHLPVLEAEGAGGGGGVGGGVSIDCTRHRQGKDVTNRCWRPKCLTHSLCQSTQSIRRTNTKQVCNLGPKPHSSGATTGFSVSLSYCTHQHVLHSLISDAGKPSVPRQEMWNERCWNTEFVRQRCCRWLLSEQKSLDL